MRTRLTLLPIALALLLLPATVHATGLLVPRDPKLPPLGIKYHRVAIDVKEGTAVTRVEQVFVNHTNRQLEATYVFPAPEGAVVMDFKLMINGEWKKGEVLPKEKANQIYTDIVRRMRDPGVLDWMSPTLFKARVFPVPARGEQKIEIRYSQVLPFLDGTYKVSYPLKTPGKAATTIQDFTLTTKIHNKTPLRTIYSPTHRISVGRSGEHQATIGFEGDRVTLDDDFVLYFGVSKEDVGLSLLTHKVKGEPGYFALMAAPKALFKTSEIMGKAITFVLDTSGSMNGAKIDNAREALAWCLSQLKSDDRFNVIRFSSDVEQLTTDSMLVASRSNIERGISFVKGFDAAGGTAIDEALATALRQDVRGATHLVVFITDGRPTIGETSIKAILANAKARNKQRARVFAFGIGDDINTHLLDKLANANGGTSQYVKPGEAIKTNIAAFYNKVAFPVLTDIELAISNVRTFATQPGRIPDLFKGGQVMVVGRYRKAGHALVRMTGSMSNAARRYDFEGVFPEERKDNAFIAQLWAHRQVGFLLDQVRLNGETAELKKEIVQLATRYGIVTPYTSYLVVEDGMMPGPGPRPEPGPRPRPPRRPFLSKKSGGFGGAPAKSAPRPAEAEMDMMEAADKSALGATSGRKGVSTAKTVRRLKEKDKADSDVASIRYAAGRAFAYRGGRWIDTTFKAGSSKTIRIAPFSDAWFQAAGLSKLLKEALSLGEQVTVVVGSVVLVVEPGGKTKLTTAELSKLRKGK